MFHNYPKTCCFTGHRLLSREERERIMNELPQILAGLEAQGFTHFMSGGATGFDLMAASAVLALKQQGHKLSLEFVLPCENHNARWNAAQKKEFAALCRKADLVTVLEGLYTDGCMGRRNRYMVENSAACISFLRRKQSGTGQTVSYAVQRGLQLLPL